MNKFVFFIFLFLVSCSPVATQIPEESQILATPEIYYTETLQPEPTIDYQATMTLVEATSQSAIRERDALARLQTEATAAYEQIIQENVRFTHEADLLTAQSIAWTATMMPTSIALTATQQAVLNTQIPIQQAIMIGQITSTHEAPELLMKTANANNTERYGFIEYFLKFILYISLSFFLVLLGLWLRTRPVERTEIIHVKEEPFIVPIDDYVTVIQKQNETVIAVKEKEKTNYPSETKYVFPCTDEQLTELADKVINKGLSLAYDNYTGNNSLFTRETYSPVYSFLQANRLAISTGIKNKGIILTDENFGPVNGRAILTGWLETKTLPDDFSTTPPLTVIGPKTDISEPVTEHEHVQHVPVLPPSGSVEPFIDPYRNFPRTV